MVGVGVGGVIVVGFFVVFDEQVCDGFGPVGAVAEEAEVGEGFFGGAELGFAFGELIAECDEEFSETFPLVLRQGEDAGDVVAFGGFFFFAEVADQVAAVAVAGRHAVEEEGVDVVVERFMVEEEFAEEAEVAAPAALAAAVDFEEGDGGVAVDFVAGGVEEGAFCSMSGEGLEGGEVTQAEFADVDGVCGGEAGGIGREVPRLHFECTHLDAAEISHSGDFGLVLGHATACAELFDFFFARVGCVVLGIRSFGGSGGILNVDEIELRVLAFWGTSNDFRGDYGDRVVTARAVFLASHQRRPRCFGCIAGSGG